MKKCICICLVMVLLASMLIIPSGVVHGQTNEALVTFESMQASGKLVGQLLNNGFVSYANGELTIKQDNNPAHISTLYANIKRTDLLLSAIANAVNGGTAKFTVHTEVKVPDYTAGKDINVGVSIGNETTSGAGVAHLFKLFDNGADTDSNEAYRTAYVQHHANLTSGAYASGIVATESKFVPGVWMQLDLLFDMAAKTVTFYVDGYEITTITCTNLITAGGRIGFFGQKGTVFRNFAVYQGLVTPENEVLVQSFEQIEKSNGTLDLEVESGTTQSYADGVLTISNPSTRGAVRFITPNLKTLLGTEDSVVRSAQFTIHTEIMVPETAGKTVKVGLFSGDQIDYGYGNRFQLIHNTSIEKDTAETFRQVYVQHEYTIPTPEFGGSAVMPAGVNFVPNEWISLDLLVDFANSTTSIYINNNLVGTVNTCTFDRMNSGGWRFGFFVQNGTASFRNLSIRKGVSEPIAEGIYSAQVVLNEKIDVIFKARVPQSLSDLHGEILYKNSVVTIAASDCQSAVDTAYPGYQTVTFTFKDILPQDIAELMTIKLYSGNNLIAERADYSIRLYCARLLPSYWAVVADSSKESLRQLLISLLNYGAESQKYFTGTTDETLMATTGITENVLAENYNSISSKAPMHEATSVRNVTEKTNSAYYWKSATLALHNTVRIRLRFFAQDISKVTVSIGTEIYDSDDFVDLGNGFYYLDYDRILANQFDTAIEANLMLEGVCVQTVTYSVNSYVRSFVETYSESDAAYDLVKAIYTYGYYASNFN
ncbi:MAG: hypothetical protein IKV74_04195 [Clostridia bacterium]|nr:hypothetical protein [Clostridia bacterium]